MTRNRRTSFVLALSFALLAFASPTPALDRGRYSVEVLVDGRPLEEYAARGTDYVEALRGREYAVRITNRTAGRIAVALSVDGLNTIDARTTTAADASKWVVEPYGSVTISGWQTGSSTARRFFFTTEDRSYGAKLGRTQNLGIVAAAVFREKRPRPQPYLRQRAPAEPDREGRGNAPAGAPQGEAKGRSASAKAETSDDYAATGIGRRVDNDVTEIALELEPYPAATLELRYEFHDALVRLGVLPRYASEQPLARRERARGFAAWCPDLD